MAKTLIALYDDFDDASEMLGELVAAGVRNEDISLVTNYASREYSTYLSRADEGTFHRLNEETLDAGDGALLGVVEGGLIGLGLALIPGVGPILAAGPLVGAITGSLLGAAAGAATGGIVAALVDLDLPEDEAGAYAEGVRRGGAMVVVDVADDLADEAEAIMEEYDPIDIEERQQAWRATGWNGFEPSASPFTPDQIARERAAWVPSHGSGNDLDDTLQASLDDTRQSVTTGTGGLTGYNMDAITEPDGGVPSRYDPAYTYGTPVEPGTDQGSGYTGHEIGGAAYSDDFDLYEKDLRTHYDTVYAGTGIPYAHYRVAYRYGYRLATDERYRSREWRDIEPDARREWDARHDGPWNTFVDAVQHMWNTVRLEA
ncbi:hypothetical protein [Aggregatilinea lenta]|uniref:hypothetical protein n=1 Tax=Aggregatilinea lenta TaxID=913108 RepID=UPI000E5A31EE|nr:hypothetical protein [Aggregatilinea lenta]